MVFDFDHSISKIQQILLKAGNVHSQLPEDKVFQTICKEVEDALMLSPPHYPRRNIYLFILLNGDADFVDVLSEDEKFAHLIDTLPKLRQQFVVELILHTGGSSFLQELVAFAPCGITIPLMEMILSAGELSCSLTRSLSSRVDLSKGCFQKLAVSGDNWLEAHAKFSSFFKLLQTHKFKWVQETEIEDVEGTDGKALQKAVNFLNDLEICSFCLRNDFTEEQICWEGFQVLCPLFSECCHKDATVTSEKSSVLEVYQECQDMIILKCFEEIQKISLNDWLEWAEIEANSGKTYQQSIGELACTLKAQLEQYDKRQLSPTVCGLNSALTTFAFKPVVQTIENLNYEEIKHELTTKNCKGKEFFKAFLQFPDSLEDPTAIEIIQNNVSLLDLDDVVQLLTMITAKVNNYPTSKDTKKLRCLAFHILRELPFDDIVSVQRTLMEKYGSSYDLSSSDFPSLLQETLNKASFSSGDFDKEGCCEFLRISILSPSAVMKKALEAGSENKSTAKFMSKVLQLLKPASRNEVFDWISTVHLQPIQIDVFPLFILELLKQEVIGGQEFVRMCAMPALHQMVQMENWALISMWLSALNYALQTILEDGNGFSGVVVLVCFVGQILELCQQTIEEFIAGCLHAREATLKVIECLKEFELSDSEKDWLFSYCSEYSLLTQCHMSSILSGNQVNFRLCFESDIKTVEQAACIIAEMLPSLSIFEWRGLSMILKECFSQHHDCNLSVFQSFYGAVLLQTTLSISDNPHHDSCLRHNLHCLGDTLKNLILPELKSQNMNRVVYDMLFLLSKLPHDIWNNAGIGLMPDLINILDKAPVEEDAVNIMSAVINTCPISNARTLLEEKLKNLSK